MIWLMEEPINVSVNVNATPETVWNLVADLPRMGEWSPECTGVAWKGGAKGPAVGVKFTGKNRMGVRRWSTQGTIVAATPGSELAWDVKAMGMSVARWSYSIVPKPDGGCTVTERWEDHRSKVLEKIAPVVSGVSDRRAHNEAGMKATLANLKTAAEQT